MMPDNAPGELAVTIPLAVGEKVRVNLFFFEMNHFNNPIQVTACRRSEESGGRGLPAFFKDYYGSSNTIRVDSRVTSGLRKWEG
jgi:hypothetical protein